MIENKVKSPLVELSKIAMMIEDTIVADPDFRCIPNKSGMRLIPAVARAFRHVVAIVLVISAIVIFPGKILKYTSAKYKRASKNNVENITVRKVKTITIVSFAAMIFLRLIGYVNITYIDLFLYSPMTNFTIRTAAKMINVARTNAPIILVIIP